MPTPDELTAIQRALWDALAPAWVRHRATLAVAWAPVHERLLELAALEIGASVLDVATGLGDPGHEAARRVAPGLVVGCDLSREMLMVASAAARDAGLTNFAAVMADGERLPVRARAFDAALCCFGLMFVPRPVLLLTEIRRALRPGARLAVATWGPATACPYHEVPDRVVRRALGVPDPLPRPDAASLHRFDAPDPLAALLTQAGFVEAAVEPYDFVAHFPGFDELWAIKTSAAPFLAKIVAGLAPRRRQEVADEVREALRPYQPAGGPDLRLPTQAMIAVATAP